MVIRSISTPIRNLACFHVLARPKTRYSVLVLMDDMIRDPRSFITTDA
jgi:hypothetical protein